MTDDLIATFNGLAEAYPADVWPPLTQEEAVEIHRTHPGFVDRVSAAMGRFFGPRFREAATALAERDATIERLTRENEEQHRALTLAGKTLSTLDQTLAEMYARAETAERERDEARAEVEHLKVFLEHIDALAKREDITAGTKCIFIRMDTSTALTAKGGENGDA